MNVMAINGQLERDAQVKTEKTTFVEFVVLVRKQGFGSYAGRTFTDKIKVIMYGRDIQTLADQLFGGVWVDVIGEAGVEAWVDRTDKTKAHGRLKITAKTVNIMVFPDDPAPAQTEPAGSPAPTEDQPPEQDQVPF